MNGRRKSQGCKVEVCCKGKKCCPVVTRRRERSSSGGRRRRPLRGSTCSIRGGGRVSGGITAGRRSRVRSARMMTSRQASFLQGRRKNATKTYEKRKMRSAYGTSCVSCHSMSVTSKQPNPRNTEDCKSDVSCHCFLRVFAAPLAFHSSAWRKV